MKQIKPINKPSYWKDRIQNPRRLQAMKIRSQVETGIRLFFLSKGFLETKTPLLVPCPGMETHIRPFRVASTLSPQLDHTLHPNSGLNTSSTNSTLGSNASSATSTQEEIFLPTSPEFAMKRLLVGGLEKIFQMSSAFRDEPRSITHRPEFTMLEWYRAHTGYETIMNDTEELFEYLALQIHGKPSFVFQGQEISVKTPWPRFKVRDLFQEIVGVDLVRHSTRDSLATECQRLGIKPNSDENWDDLYFKIWLNLIEPKLPANQACLITRYPSSQAALSVVDADPDGSLWAKRFEAYAGGIELGNAFEELTDPVEQRQRFIDDMDLREKVYGPSFPKNPLDEGFLEALEEGMPPSGGIAVGVDRLVMLYADEPDIDYTLWI